MNTDKGNSLMAYDENAIARMFDEMAIGRATAAFADAATGSDTVTLRTLCDDDAASVIGSTSGQPFERRAHGVDDIMTLYSQLHDVRVDFIQVKTIVVTDQAA